VDLEKIIYAKDWGYEIKLLAIAKTNGGRVELRVHPTLIPSSHLLSAVKNEDNAVFVKGDLIGESMIYGKGAGSLPAASSVLSDIFDCARYMSFSDSGMHIYFSALGQSKRLKQANFGELVTKYYLSSPRWIKGGHVVCGERAC
jgi:homoserine dehydrogenase